MNGYEKIELSENSWLIIKKQFWNINKIEFDELWDLSSNLEDVYIKMFGKLIKVPGLTAQGKMSKSSGDADTIVFDEEDQVIRKKIMRAVTDNGPTGPGMPKSEGLQNLFDIMNLVSDKSTITHFED